MSSDITHAHASPSWFVPPGDFDPLAWFAVIFIALAIYGVVTLYSAFDRWAEHKSKGTPLAKTIPTMLTIALLYEIFPLGHFNILLPISAILIALMADWTRFNLTIAPENEPVSEIEPPSLDEEQNDDEIIKMEEVEAAKNV